MDRNDRGDVDRMIAEIFSNFRADGDCRPDLQRGLAILRQRRTTRNGRRRRGILIASAAIMACVPIAALPSTLAFAERWVSACVEETAAVRAFLVGPGSGRSRTTAYVEPAERRVAPDFALITASGQRVKLFGFSWQSGSPEFLGHPLCAVQSGDSMVYRVSAVKRKTRTGGPWGIDG